MFYNPFSNAIALNPVTGQTNPNYTGAPGQMNSNDPALIDWMFGNTGTNQQERQAGRDGGEHGADDVGLLTGDNSINGDARIVVRAGRAE